MPMEKRAEIRRKLYGEFVDPIIENGNTPAIQYYENIKTAYAFMEELMNLVRERNKEDCPTL